MRHIKALIGGVWHAQLDETEETGHPLAAARGFDDRVSVDGSTGFPAEPGRYHLYVSYACPWAHRAILYRRLKRLEHVVSMSVLHPRWAGPEGWHFASDENGGVDPVAGRRTLYEVYRAARPDYTGRVTVPVLWDKATGTIVSNDSTAIMRMVGHEFDAWGDASVDFRPDALRDAIDAMNAWLLPAVCRGVYRTGFARDQAAYEQSVRALFAALDQLEERLARQPYLLGDRVTECDWHLFATLCRFDAVYHSALRCNLRRLIDYPALSAYTWSLHALPGVAETVRLDHVKRHYHDAIGEIDPTIVPLGPAEDYASADAPFRAEVLGLHAFLERWLKGETPRGDGPPLRLVQALAEEFSVVHPDGMRDGKAGVLRNFADAYGKKPAAYRLQISRLTLRQLASDLCLASYVETHHGEPGRARIGNALLRQRTAGEPVQWLFLQETALPAPAAAAVEAGRGAAALAA